MATALYTLWKKAIMDASTNSSIVDDPTNGPFCALVTAAYTAVVTGASSHQFFSTVSASQASGSTNQRITPTATTVGSTDGVFDGGDVTYTAVPAGAAVTQLVIYRLNSGGAGTWRLISDYDTAGGGLPVTPNGGNITVTWNALGIFQLSDARAKRDIRRIGAVGRLPVYEYRYSVEGAPLMAGFMAQEVERVVPEAVKVFRGYRHVDYFRAVLGVM